MRHFFLLLGAAAVMSVAAGCEEVDHSGELHQPGAVSVPLDTVARLLSSLPMEAEHLAEVYDAVSSSSGNGYDEEYMMRDLFVSPGAGVGMTENERSIRTKAYSRPLKDLIVEHLGMKTRSSVGSVTADEYVEALENSDIQIYWPYSSEWDGEDFPVITFDPGNDADSNIGYCMKVNADGSRSVEEVVVDEEMAQKKPVWVVNRNDDSGFTPLEMLRKDDPDWGTGGSVIVKPSVAAAEAASGKVRSLVLKDFMMRRNYDCWFAGASEFFIKCGAVEDFTASTEAELKLYSPKITDFMLTVKRNKVGQTVPLSVMLVSQWTDQLEDVAFMLTEDDGGTRTEWKCSAGVKVKSKSYGFDVALPFNTRDDIVWRGQLSARYLERYDGITSRFGDVDLTFSFLER